MRIFRWLSVSWVQFSFNIIRPHDGRVFRRCNQESTQILISFFYKTFTLQRRTIFIYIHTMARGWCGVWYSLVWWYDGVMVWQSFSVNVYAGPRPGVWWSVSWHTLVWSPPSYHLTDLDQKFIWLDFSQSPLVHLSRENLSQQGSVAEPTIISSQPAGVIGKLS